MFYRKLFVAVSLLGSVITIVIGVAQDHAQETSRLSKLDAGEAKDATGGSGACFWDSIVSCSEDEGCIGVECGSGPGPFACPASDAVDNPTPPLGMPTFYTICGNAQYGREGCGLPTAVECGVVETCKSRCTPGANLGSGFDDHIAYCVAASSAPNNVNSVSVVGGNCGP